MEYGVTPTDDDPMKKKSSFAEALTGAADKVKEKASEVERTVRPSNLFEILKGEKKDKEEKEETNPFLEVLKVEKDKRELAKEEKEEVSVEPGAVEVEDSTEGAGEAIEMLDNEEIAEVAKGYAEAAIADATAELSEADHGTSDEAEAAASLAFAEAVKEQAETGEALDETAIEEIGAKTAEEFDIEATIEELDDDEDEHEVEIIEPETVTTDAEDDAEEELPVPIATTPTPIVVPPSPPAAGPPSPAALATPVAPLETDASPNSTNSKNVAERRRSAGAVLGGALIGYMIGRRRGRINTEAKLLPIQHKLEKQVAGLQNTLTEQEIKLRKLAAEQFEQSHHRTLKYLQKIQEMREKQLDSKKTQESLAPASEKLVDRHNELDSNAERDIEKMADNRETNIEDLEVNVSPSSVEAMTIPLLLSLAETIVIGETSLRTMYEKGRLDQRQLRRLVKAYLNGEQIEKIMPEILGPEIIDEQSHNQDHSQPESQPTNAPNAVVNPFSDSINPPFPQSGFQNPNEPTAQPITHDDGDANKTSRPSVLIYVIIAILVAIVIIAVAA